MVEGGLSDYSLHFDLLYMKYWSDKKDLNIICAFEGDILGTLTLGGGGRGAISCDGRSGPQSVC